LKTATHSLLGSLQNAAARTGDVYVSIVPFSRDVNVKYDSSVVDATWIRWDDGTDASWDGSHGTCSKSGYSPRSSCTAQGTCSVPGNSTQSACNTAGTCSVSGNNSQSNCNSAGTCSNTNYNSQSSCTSAGHCSIGNYNSQSSCTSNGSCNISGNNSQSSCQSAHACSDPSYNSKNPCQNHGGTWYSGTWTFGTWTPETWTPATWTPATWTPSAHSTWNGCVADRDQPYDTTNANAIAGDTSSPSTLFFADQYSNCPLSLLPMTYDWTALNAKVDAMFPNGNT